ncbi:hypothetical protein FE257_001793 [Aspergillus nanangensis]|uniref:Mediator complex subunit 27-domain-containing protein n=1 Tax=Aspergillus nanangensis TaxID=2582783 RepID=A0AAD4CDR8_ASPNN|nr:hypothetical protein FE257_001793 [Aspergillus nanangensis]
MKIPSSNDPTKVVPAPASTQGPDNSKMTPMGTVNTNDMPTNSSAITKNEPAMPLLNPNLAPTVEVPTEISEAELQLVSSLAKLQKMEAMIHELRTLLPDRLLDPLVPIVNPGAMAGRAVPKSPQMLYDQLSDAARGGVAEVTEFQNMWRSADMKAMWENIEAEIKRNGGRMLQPTGVWDRNYEAVLDDLMKREEAKKELQRQTQEEQDRAQIQATEGGWQAIVDGFVQKADGSAVRVVPSRNEATIAVVLIKAGMTFRVQMVGGAGENPVPDWKVEMGSVPGSHLSKVEAAVAECVNSRARKWDLAHLLDMISAYAGIKQTPCVKCNKMTDNAANLPTIRQQKQQLDSQPPIWEACHPTCV